jgi:hypothetical protein
MQPPPPPLNLQELRNLVSEAEVIVVGKIGKVKEIDSVNGTEARKTLEVILNIEELLKGDVSGKTIVIKETYPTFDSPKTGPAQGVQGPPKTIIGLRAGPSCYHGRYKEGERIIVLLAKIVGTNEYKPLGSGTYDKHLCAFPIEGDGIQTFYFRFAADVANHSGSEKKFIDLIKRLTR